MKATFTFLGTGASTGVPMIGCKCKVCHSKDPKNSRLRPTGLIEFGEKKLLIDAGPDIRQQLLQKDIDHLDGLMLTHSHFDHIGGLDELRVFFFKNKQPLDCLLSSSTRREVEKRYHYMFAKQNDKSSYSAKFHFHELGSNQEFFMGLPIQPVYYYQGGMEITGFVVGNFAYLCDVKEYDEEIFSKLKGVEILVLSALKKEPSLMHLSLDEAVEFCAKAGAKKCYFTHLAHELDYHDGMTMLPSNIELAFDGLSFTFNLGYDK